MTTISCWEHEVESASAYIKTFSYLLKLIPLIKQLEAGEVNYMVEPRCISRLDPVR